MSATSSLARSATSPDWAAARDTADRLLAPWREEAAAPGGAILAFDASRIRVEVTAGLESLSAGTPFSGASVVRYASVTKHVLAALALRDGPPLEDPLGTHLPELQGELAGVSLGRALDMTGGLPDLRETLSLLGLTAPETVEAGAALDFLARQRRLNFAPGSEISYSNTGYRLVEQLLARRGHRFADFVAEVSRPLGIAWHAPELWSAPVPGLVPGYWRDAAGWQQGFSGMHLSASGCLAGSGADLARWGQAMLKGEGAAAGLLARQGAPRPLSDGRPTGYGLGLAHDRIGGVALIGHGGSLIGYKTYLLLAPEPGLGVVLVANREDAASHAMALAVMAALLGTELPPPAPALLPEGLYAEADGPGWLEITGGSALFLGAGDTLHEGGDGSAVTLSAHLPMRLRATAEGIEGEIGHVARRFRPVSAAPDAGLEGLQGEWRCAAEGGSFRIEGNMLLRGIGPARRRATLRPLGGGRHVAQLPDGPWPLRLGLAFAGDTVALASHRSRVLRFHRAG